MKLKDEVLCTIVDTTKAAGSFTPGTIVTKQKGDLLWWVLSIALIVGMVYGLFHPALLRAMFA